MILQWINLLFRKYTMKSLSISRICYAYTIYFANSLWFNHEFTWSNANSFWNHYLFREVTMNSLSFSRIHNEFTWFSRMHDEFTIYIAKSLSISRIQYELSFCFVNSLYLLRRQMNSLSFSRINYQLTWCFKNSL